MSQANHAIRFTCLSQEDLLESGCLDFRMAIGAAESALLAHRDGDVMFPEKIVQIFNQETQERINCLPATLLPEKVCGMKWVSVFPPNVPRFGLQNLTALFILSEIEKGFPIAVLEGTLASNIRVGAMGALAAKHFAPRDARVIGFIGSGEQAKMHLLAMKTVCPTLTSAGSRPGPPRRSGSSSASSARWSRTWSWWRPQPTAPGPWRGPTSWSPRPAPRRRCSRPRG
jgi:ornithine cyclodeaminase/alanine dehydrogenase-like protein (mu-crystallin family)